MQFRYISLFSGIGGFELAIHAVFPDAICVAYSEVDSYAIQVYQHHFPNHINLGDIRNITYDKIKQVVDNAGGCDLIVGGFPCKNLSSLSRVVGKNNGLDGKQSGLFYNMVYICEVVKELCPNVSFIFENNNSMSKAHKGMITDILERQLDIRYCRMIDNGDFGVQIRKRLFWTNFYVEETNPTLCVQTWKDVLDPVSKCTDIVSDDIIATRSRFSRNVSFVTKRIDMIRVRPRLWKFQIKNDTSIGIWNKAYHSDMGEKGDIAYAYPIGKSRCITCSTTTNNYIVDRRVSKTHKSFVLRHFNDAEKERLFFLPSGWVTCLGFSKSRNAILLGNTVSVKVIQYIIEHL